MSDYITTYTGKHFYPTNPKAEDLEIRDIAHALSLICRGNGQVKSFFSVAQHCILCAREALAIGLQNRMVLACLLHDASEAYLSDVPRPFKKEQEAYCILEQRLLDIVYKKYLGCILTKAETEQLKAIDDSFLYFDLLYLLEEPLNCERPKIHVKPDYTFVPFAKVEEEYLRIFYKYSLQVPLQDT